jgi:hypothetical protein
MVRNKPRAGGSIREPSSVPGSVPDLLVIRAPKFPDVVHSNPHAQAGRSSGFRFLSRWIGPRHHFITGGHGLTVKKTGATAPERYVINGPRFLPPPYLSGGRSPGASIRIATASPPSRTMPHHGRKLERCCNFTTKSPTSPFTVTCCRGGANMRGEICHEKTCRVGCVGFGVGGDSLVARRSSPSSSSLRFREARCRCLRWIGLQRRFFRHSCRRVRCSRRSCDNKVRKAD